MSVIKEIQDYKAMGIIISHVYVYNLYSYGANAHRDKPINAVRVGTNLYFL